MSRLCSLWRYCKFTGHNFQNNKCTMSVKDDIINDAVLMYRHSVQTVLPEELISHSVVIKSNKLKIQEKEFIIEKNVYVVGFGKAVLGMAVSLVNLLQDHFASGILSVPNGMINYDFRQKLSTSRIEVFEGARDNIPDRDSLLAAEKISRFVSSLGESSILVVLISGGGSALLPSPKPPLTLEEKQKVIKILASKGATIEEINVVRKKLSLLKGGGLAKLARPATVISLILSDIIGDPVELIASGPTIVNCDDPKLPMFIVEKYGVKDVLPQSAIQLLQDNSTGEKSTQQSFDFVNNFIIGNNTLALNAAAEKAKELSYKPVIMTNRLCGLATYVAQKIIQLVDGTLRKDLDEILHACKELNIEKDKGYLLLDSVKELGENKGLCILFGGETTVEVKGKGIGGRNQELALAGSLELHKRKIENSVVMLAAGTDGIDGPTDAAGALASPFLVDIANKEGIDAQSFLDDNNSYSFYNSLQNGLFHVKIGHTGTNVMDIIIVIIKRS